MGPLAWELGLGTSLGKFSLELCLGNSGSPAWELLLGILHLVSCDGAAASEAGGAVGPQLGEPGSPVSFPGL